MLLSGFSFFTIGIKKVKVKSFQKSVHNLIKYSNFPILFLFPLMDFMRVYGYIQSMYKYTRQYCATTFEEINNVSVNNITFTFTKT